MPQKTKNTPMMEQYLSIKAQYQDAFLFYRLETFMNYLRRCDQSVTAFGINVDEQKSKCRRTYSYVRCTSPCSTRIYRCLD